MEVDALWAVAKCVPGKCGTVHDMGCLILKLNPDG